MEVRREGNQFILYKEQTAIGTGTLEGSALWVEIAPAWRGRGYGSYLLKELLRRGGGLDHKAASCFTAPLPADAAGRAL
ncbi:GNAT family N-acetyltransferase, partial [uncultured Subdoligranulum sp.]|uniref:GNAT family N-acetyltransferase n=1 Tax=uncultured Subdoligranulum sp. TaxID=512298 RepID=UPI002628A0EB